MAIRIPLVLSSGQVEQLPSGDSILGMTFNIGPPGLILVTSTTISYSQTHMIIDAISNQKVRTISGGSPNDLLYIYGTTGMNKVVFEPNKPGGNISSQKKRTIKRSNQVLVFLNSGSSWIEVSWSR